VHQGYRWNPRSLGRDQSAKQDKIGYDEVSFLATQFVRHIP
jgi:hypothetical protein